MQSPLVARARHSMGIFCVGYMNSPAVVRPWLLPGEDRNHICSPHCGSATVWKGQVWVACLSLLWFSHLWEELQTPIWADGGLAAMWWGWDSGLLTSPVMVSLLPGKVEFRGSSSPHGCSLPAAQGGWGSGPHQPSCCLTLAPEGRGWAC